MKTLSQIFDNLLLDEYPFKASWIIPTSLPEDLKKTDFGYQWLVEVPGLSKADATITVDKKGVHLRGKTAVRTYSADLSLNYFPDGVEKVEAVILDGIATINIYTKLNVPLQIPVSIS